MLEPLFEFSGACAGCGETPYLKLVTQLFGDRMIVANATGCSSIYGANLPTTPWTTNREGRGPAWNNSLFEDNAEFGLGIRLGLEAQARLLVERLAGVVGHDAARSLLDAAQDDEGQIRAQRERVARLKDALAAMDGAAPGDVRHLLALADTLVRKGVWIIGGVLPLRHGHRERADRYLTLIASLKRRVSVPVVASLNAASSGGWVRYAGLIEQAGADAIELNLYRVAADPQRTSAEVEEDDLRPVVDVRAAIRIPLAVKLSPYYSAFANFARRVVDASADGLVLFNRFYQPDVDVDRREAVPTIELSQPWELRLPLRWIAILRAQLGGGVSLAATSGVHSGRDVAKALLVGANVARRQADAAGVRHRRVRSAARPVPAALTWPQRCERS